jgi:copper chaperone CopZ
MIIKTMKKIVMLVLTLVMGISVCSAEAAAISATNSNPEKAVKSKKVEVVKFNTNLDCENCAKKILNVIPFKKGVKDCVVDVPTKTVEVTFDPRKTNAEVLKAELAKIDVLVVEPQPCAGTCVGEHTKQDACCSGHDHGHSHEGHNH